MLNYNIYNNITDNDFLEIEKRLTIVEDKMIRKLRPLGWKLTTPIKGNDALIVDFIIDDKLFMGNIGITYNDLPGDQLFSLYVTKSYDEGEKRYFVKNVPFENKKLSFYENNIRLIIEKALILYESWDKAYVCNNG